MSEPRHPETADENGADDQPKSPATILDQEIEHGLKELERPVAGLSMSALSAGLDIGFSMLAVGALLTMAEGELSPPVVRMLTAAGYSVGFIFVIIGRSELYTEHTTLAFLPVLARRASIARLLRLWAIVLAANVVGTAIFAGLLAVVGPALGVIDEAVLVTAAVSSLAHDAWVILLSAVLAGWMMGLVSWLVTAARTTGAEIFLVALVTSLIGLAELHHCIVGSVKVLAAIFAGSAPTFVDYLRFMALAVTGNTVGGVVFVAVVKFGHASQSRVRPVPFQ